MSGQFLPMPYIPAARPRMEGRSSITSGAQPAEQVQPQRLALDPPGALASEEEPCTLSSLPAGLLKLVAETLLIPNASQLSAQSLASFAAASTMCLAAAQGGLRAALVTALEEVRAALGSGANHGPGPGPVKILCIFFAEENASMRYGINEDHEFG